ncbi:hypothetical protein PG991_005459 [Apiospora marii]|uniref:Uncharacterized protein n=1 Tax=Apiospora marii TaxID=335849 RepID=A0ABR1S985_9PEZI
MNYNGRTYVSGKVLKDSSSDDSAKSCIHVNNSHLQMRLPDGRCSSPSRLGNKSEANGARQSASDSDYNMGSTDDKKLVHEEPDQNMLLDAEKPRQASHGMIQEFVNNNIFGSIHDLLDTVQDHNKELYHKLIKTEQDLLAIQKTLSDTKQELLAEQQARFKLEAENRDLSSKVIEREQAAILAEDNAQTERQLRESEHERMLQDLRQQCDAKDKNLREAAVKRNEDSRTIEWMGQEQRASREEMAKLREAIREHEQKAEEEKQERKRLWKVISDMQRRVTRFMLKRRRSRAKAAKDVQTIAKQGAMITKFRDIISERDQKATEDQKERERLRETISSKENELAQAQQENLTLLKKSGEDQVTIAGLEATVKKLNAEIAGFKEWWSSSPLKPFR